MISGTLLITTSDDGCEVQPVALVTVKVYVPAGSPVMVVLVPLPFLVVPPGVLVTVHVPDDGKPFKTTLPVAIAQVGWVIVPTVGAEGVTGRALMTTLAEAVEIQPAALVTVKV